MKYNTEKNIAYIKANVPKDRLEQYNAEIRADERTKCIRELMLAMSKSPFLDDKLSEVKIWIANQQKEGGENG